MTLAPPTVADLALFSGRDSSDFSNYAVQALAQATLMFYLATDLENYPDDISLSQLAKNGIMDMADNIYASQPYRDAVASPYQSETIGTYSYSKALKAVRRGDATGITWFDLAVNKLKSSNARGVSYGSIRGMEWDGLVVGSDGQAVIQGAYTSVDDSRLSWETDTQDIVHNHPNF